MLIQKNISFIYNTVTDPEGRFIIMNATINNSLITITSIYGPNNDGSGRPGSAVVGADTRPVTLCSQFSLCPDFLSLTHCVNKGHQCHKKTMTILLFCSRFLCDYRWRFS